jgi:hypothetical protein
MDQDTVLLNQECEDMMVVGRRIEEVDREECSNLDLLERQGNMRNLDSNIANWESIDELVAAATHQTAALA